MAASPAVTFDGVKLQLAKRQYAPIYLLHGEEGYFIDALVKEFEEILSPEERDFNLYTLYAPQVSPDTVMDTCRRYPMMAERQVVILKEAQAIRADQLNRLHLYASQPSETTVLVICCRGVLAKAKNLIDEMKAHGGVIFESKRIDERNIGNVINEFIKDKGLNIEPKGLAMLKDYVGTDLSRLYNEIDKLTVVLGQGATVTPESIERNIGVSKDYNNFELIDAIARKDALRVFNIVEYFRNNSKNNPTILTVSTLFTFFSNLLILHFCKDKSDGGMCNELGFRWPRALENYKPALRNYNAYKTIEIISAIREFDTKSKGIGSRQNEYDLLKDLAFRILNAAGTIVI